MISYFPGQTSSHWPLTQSISDRDGQLYIHHACITSCLCGLILWLSATSVTNLGSPPTISVLFPNPRFWLSSCILDILGLRSGSQYLVPILDQFRDGGSSKEARDESRLGLNQSKLYCYHTTSLGIGSPYLHRCFMIEVNGRGLGFVTAKNNPNLNFPFSTAHQCKYQHCTSPRGY